MGFSRASKNLILSKMKAKEMLMHGTVHGKRLTKKQRGLFGLIASGKRPKKY